MFKFMLYITALLITIVIGGVIGLVILGLNFSPSNLILYGASYIITFLFNRGLNFVIDHYLRRS